jgi:hypothetical protein
MVGPNPDAIRAEVRNILDGRGKVGVVPALWDGHAAVRIADILERDLGRRKAEQAKAAGSTV